MPAKPLKVHELAVTTSKTLTLARANLEELGIEISHYGKRDYSQTQKIGAVINFLGIDGLIAPSARWECENLMIFSANHSLNEKLETLSSEEVDWQAWARAAEIITTNGK